MSRDPLEGAPPRPLSLHRYLYAHGSPTRLVDRGGLEATSINEISYAATENNALTYAVRSYAEDFIKDNIVDLAIFSLFATSIGVSYFLLQTGFDATTYSVRLYSPTKKSTLQELTITHKVGEDGPNLKYLEVKYEFGFKDAGSFLVKGKLQQGRWQFDLGIKLPTIRIINKPFVKVGFEIETTLFGGSVKLGALLVPLLEAKLVLLPPEQAGRIEAGAAFLKF